MDQDWSPETIGVLAPVVGMIPVSARLTDLSQVLAYDVSIDFFGAILP